MAGELLLEAYPLTWPERQARTPSHRRRRGKFQMGLAQARDELLGELGRIGARNVVISTNVPVRRDGLPYADAREPEDPGVAVYFERRRGGAEWVSFVIACDTYDKVKFNIRAVGATIEALRAIERHGSTEMLEQAFTGFAALPPAWPNGAPWWDVLGLPPGASEEQIRAAHRELAMVHHPDRGGDATRMAEINAARDAALTTRSTSS